MSSKPIPLSLPSTVTSQQKDGLYQVRSPELLGIHATVAQILHDCYEADVGVSQREEYSQTAVLRKDGMRDSVVLFAVSSLGPS